MPQSEEDRLYMEKARSFGISKQRQSKRTPVIADEGRNAGQVVGYQTEHADGHVDATSVRQEVQLAPGARVVKRKET